MTDTPLKDRIIARVNFLPGITAERIAAACGHRLSRSKLSAAERSQRSSFSQCLTQLVECGELQEYHSPTSDYAIYYPADWEPPSQLFQPKQEPTMKQQRVQPVMLPPHPEHVPARRGDVMTQALWDALAIFEKRGEPFTRTDLLNFLDTGDTVLKTRREVADAIDDAIARLGKPNPVERRKEAAKRTRTARNAAKAVTPAPTKTIKEEPIMTPLANTTLEQKQTEQREMSDRTLAEALPQKIGELMRRAGAIDEEIEELVRRLAEARADRDRYQKLIDGAIALQEYVSPVLEEPEEISESEAA